MMDLRRFLEDLNLDEFNELDMNDIMLKLLESGYHSPNDLADVYHGVNGVKVCKLVSGGPKLNRAQLDFIAVAVRHAVIWRDLRQPVTPVVNKRRKCK